MNPSKRSSSVIPYNNVLPFDEKFLHAVAEDLLPLDAPLKFVSWNDFDVALETDQELREKLLNVAQEKQLTELLHLVSPKRRNELFDRFIWLPGNNVGGGNDVDKHGMDQMYYRTDRRDSNIEKDDRARKSGQEEKLEYNFQNSA